MAQGGSSYDSNFFVRDAKAKLEADAAAKKKSEDEARQASEQAFQQGLTDQKTALETAQAEQRQYWRDQETAQRNEYAKQQQDAEQALVAQEAAFEAARAAKVAAAEQAERDKATKLAGEQQINGKTLLEAMERITSVRDDDLIAGEDKKLLSGDDKAQMFDAAPVDEEDKKKAKQTYLEKILGSSPAGTPNTKE